MTKLRLYFALFFALLAIPIAILLLHTYNNLEQESFFFFRKATQGLTITLEQRISENLEREEGRPYTHYRFIHVPERPLPEKEGLNLSPLASFPVESEIPGILGYFQIDPDGSLQTPLLPDPETASAIEVPQRDARVALHNQIATLLQGRRFQVLRTGEDFLEDPDDSLKKKAEVTTFKQNLESNLDTRLEQEYYRSNSPEFSRSADSENSLEDRSAPSDYVGRKVQRTSEQQARVFESQLKGSYSDELARVEEAETSPAAPAAEKAEASRETTRDRRTRLGLSLAERDQAEGEIGAEVDPFQCQLVDDEWLVFHRKVWWQDRRYIQGFVASLWEFTETHLDRTVLHTALPETASYLLFYQGELLPQAGHPQSPQKPLLLDTWALPHPLDDFQVAMTVAALPRSPAYTVVNVLAAFLSVLFIGGFLGVYRLTASQLELSQKKNDFVSAVSHELKTPLTAIRMYGEMLMEGWADGEKKQRYYQYIYDESERLSRLIQNVLTLAEIERKEWQVQLESHPPVRFIQDLVQKLKPQLQRTGFEVETVIEGEPETIQADADALTQILINLIDNAIKFSKEAETKKIVLTVSQLGPDCFFRVRDFGPGIPRDKLKKIFQKFYRADDEMTRTTRGTGIGLTLVQMLAQAMGASVDVANRDPGTEFIIRFPRAA